jgi:FkbM family methyltransferase
MAAGIEVCRLPRDGEGVKLFDAWWLPNDETHLEQWMRTKNRRVDGRLTYQYEKYEAALKHVPRKRVAVDVGSHCGLWAYWMVRDFGYVECFEPKMAHVLCWNANMINAPNARLHPVALGEKERTVGLTTGPASSGDTAVDFKGSDVPMVTLDSYEFPTVNLLKIDCEGYEAFVLEGARETLLRCRPTVIVEQKPGHGQRFGRGEHDALHFLVSLGAQHVWDYAGDYVLVFPEVH